MHVGAIEFVTWSSALSRPSLLVSSFSALSATLKKSTFRFSFASHHCNFASFYISHQLEKLKIEISQNVYLTSHQRRARLLLLSIYHIWRRHRGSSKLKTTSPLHGDKISQQSTTLHPPSTHKCSEHNIRPIPEPSLLPNNHNPRRRKELYASSPALLTRSERS